MRTLTLIASLICFTLTATAASAEKRVAFVVGNGTYKNVAALPNPPIDAKAMAGVLRNVGFEVVEGADLSQTELVRTYATSSPRSRQARQELLLPMQQRRTRSALHHANSLRSAPGVRPVVARLPASPTARRRPARRRNPPRHQRGLKGHRRRRTGHRRRRARRLGRRDRRRR